MTHHKAVWAGGHDHITITIADMKLIFFWLSPLIILGFALTLPTQTPDSLHLVLPGDTWTALSYQYGLPVESLQAANYHPNRHRQPAIGSTAVIPGAGAAQMGTLTRPYGSLLATAVRHNRPLWQIARQNGVASPYLPLLYRPIFIPGGTAPPRDLPAGMAWLEVSQAVAHPGQALGLRGMVQEEEAITTVLAGNEMDSFINGRYFLALTGTGAFWGSGQPELAIRINDQPLWTQPWQFNDPNLWEYQQLTLTGAAADIDQAAIEVERERLLALWEQNTPLPQWSGPFQIPLTTYLEISSPFGARRAYNGGPYRTYHEGVDYSAYGGTPVHASAAGTVVIAEQLYVRGGAVIIDHGLGIYTGFYHMSEVLVAPGDNVQAGQLIGAVGTTGLSTGNHLHWDLLVDGIWVDAQAWQEQGMACWILAGWGSSCPAVDDG